jgi:hypothetical protein
MFSLCFFSMFDSREENRSLSYIEAVAAPLVSLHVAPNTESFAASSMGTLEGLLASV